MTEPAQSSLFDLHECPRCNGTGQRANEETGLPDYCRCCQGTGLVDYDPAKLDEIPFG